MACRVILLKCIVFFMCFSAPKGSRWFSNIPVYAAEFWRSVRKAPSLYSFHENPVQIIAAETPCCLRKKCVANFGDCAISIAHSLGREGSTFSSERTTLRYWVNVQQCFLRSHSLQNVLFLWSNGGFFLSLSKVRNGCKDSICRIRCVETVR